MSRTRFGNLRFWTSARRKSSFAPWLGCLVAIGAVVPVQADWTENFDNYQTGSQMIGQGGWEGWWLDPNAGALVSNEQAHTSPHSVKCELATDLAHPNLGATSGQWRLTAWHFVPSRNNVSTYFIGNNEYDGQNGTAQWSIEVNFTEGGKVLDDFRDESNDINTIYDRWVKLHFDIDLDANTMKSYYNDVLLSDGVYAIRGGAVALENIDLFSNGPVEFFDDFGLVEAGGGCRNNADCDDLDHRTVDICTQGECYHFRPDEPGTKCCPPAQPGGCGVSCGGGGGEGDLLDSVYLHSGEFYQSATDLRIPGQGQDIIWARKYRSFVGPNTAQGNGWDSSYNVRVEADGEDIVVYDGNTRRDTYQSQPGNIWIAKEFFREISKDDQDVYTLKFADTGLWQFHPLDGSPRQGKLTHTIDRNGNTLSLNYDPEGRLVKVADTLDHEIVVAYNPDGFVESVTDFVGRQVSYEYYQDGDDGGSFGDLKSVTTPAVVRTDDFPIPPDHEFPQGKTTTYTYSKDFVDERLNHNLLTITDPREQTYLTNVYSPTQNPDDLVFDHVVRQVLGEPGDIINLDYVRQTAESEDDPVIKAIVHDRVGNVKELFFDRLGRGVKQIEYTRGLRRDDPRSYITRYEFNDDSLPTRTIFPNGNSETFKYDVRARDPRSRGNLLKHCRLPGRLGGDQNKICESFKYEDGFGGCCGTNFVKQWKDPRGNVARYSHDDQGNRTRIRQPVKCVIENFEYDTDPNSPARGRMTAHVLPDNGSDHRRRDEYHYYDSGPQSGYLKEVVVDVGGFNLTTGYEYNRVGNAIRVFDANGHDTQYVYNQLNQVVQEKSRQVSDAIPVRYETETFHDANDNVVRTDVQNINALGEPGQNAYFTTILEYGILNELTRTCQEVDGTFAVPRQQRTCDGLPEANFITTEFEHDKNRNRTLVRKGEASEGRQPGNVVRTRYDDRDLVFQVIRGGDGRGRHSTTQYDYDGNKNLQDIRAGLEDDPHHTVRRFDGYNRVMTSTDDMGNVMEVHYDANGNTVSEKTLGELLDVPGGNGNLRLYQAAYTYDKNNRRTRTTVAFFDPQTQQPIGDGESITVTEYSCNSQVLRTIDDRGHATATSYDTANRAGTVTDAEGNRSTSDYDLNSNVVAVVETEIPNEGEPEVFRTENRHDYHDRLIWTKDNVGNVRQFTYNSRNNVVASIDALGHQVATRYDGVGRLHQTIRDMNGNGPRIGDAEDIVTTQVWDDSSHLISQTDDGGNTTRYVYDDRDLRTDTIYADRTRHSVTEYDVHGNPLRTLDANETEVEFQYDGDDRLVRKDIAPGPGVSDETTFETYQYDGLSRLVQTQDDDSVVTLAYDSLSNVMKESLNGIPTSAVHDGVGNRIQSTYPGDGPVVMTTFDVLNRKSEISDQSGLIARYDYIGPGRVQRREYGNGTRTTYAYDGARRITETKHVFDPGGPGEVVLDHRTYAWDELYNKTQRQDEREGDPAKRFTHGYAYDPGSRLTDTEVKDRNGAGVRETAYTLDGVGNRTLVEGRPDPGPYECVDDRPEPADCQMNQYTTTSFDGRRYDRNGNLVLIDFELPGERRLSYNYRNEMVEYLMVNSGERHVYAYDAAGRRIAKIVDADGPEPQETRFFFDAGSWQEIEEQDAEGATRASYVFGLYVDEVLTMRRDDVDRYYHADDLFNVMAVTDAAGNVIERYEYQDYGDPTFMDASGIEIPESAISNPLLFTGRRYDAETGWFYFRTRHLDPLAGRFTTPDTIGIWGDSFAHGNPFSYVGNKPFSALDPNGLLVKELAQMVISATICCIKYSMGAGGGDCDGGRAWTYMKACMAAMANSGGGGGWGAPQAAMSDSGGVGIGGVEAGGSWRTQAIGFTFGGGGGFNGGGSGGSWVREVGFGGGSFAGAGGPNRPIMAPSAPSGGASRSVGAVSRYGGVVDGFRQNDKPQLAGGNLIVIWPDINKCDEWHPWRCKFPY